MSSSKLRIGTAGWTVPGALRSRFPTAGTGLQRYASRFTAVEINTTFYRPHRASTFARWRDSTPEDFRFSVKAPRAITHDAGLQGCEPAIRRFIQDLAPLDNKLDAILVQLPPKLGFDPALAEGFFAELRRAWPGDVVCEPRHVSWFDPPADLCLARHRIARAAADPARHPRAAEPGGWSGFAYWRMHGSPRMYSSSYSEARLDALAEAIAGHRAEAVWCIFDNTTSGAAAENALDLTAKLEMRSPGLRR